MHEHPVAIGDRCDDARRDVVLGLEHARRLEIPVERLGPELGSRLDVDELGTHADGRASSADAPLQHVARAEFGGQGALVSRFSFQASHRGTRDDREIPKPREAGSDLLGDPVGQGREVGVGADVLERQHGDP